MIFQMRRRVKLRHHSASSAKCRQILLLLLLVLGGGCQEKKAAPVAAEKEKESDEIAVSCLYIERCLSRMEAEKDLTSDQAASIIQSAERTLPVFWGTDPKTLSNETNAKIEGYSKAIRVWMDRINETKSAAILEEIKGFDAATAIWKRENTGAKWQEWIDKSDECVAAMQRKMIGMSAGKSLDKATKIILDNQWLGNDCRHQQLTAYQKNAVKRCHQFAEWALTNTTLGSESTLNKFNESEIAKIDSNLLGSDARRIYEVALAQMDAKLRDRPRAEYLKKLTETEKWPLSDY